MVVNAMFITTVAIVAILSSVFWVPFTAYKIGKKVGQKLIYHSFLRWVSSIAVFILSILFLVILSEVFIQLFLAVSGANPAVDFIANAILAPLIGLSTLIGLGILIHTLLQPTPQEVAARKRRRGSFIISALVVIGVLLVPYFFWQSVLAISSHNKKFAELIVLANLKSHCSPKNTSNCHELRPLPAVLQNKKIILASSTYAEFSPYELNYKQAVDLDVDGFVNFSSYKSAKTNFIAPQSGKSGYLQDKEYKIIRAVYSYKCSYCIDSSNFGYVVLENNGGYRFITFLDDFDSSSSSSKRIPWDQQLPFDGLGVDWFLESTE